GGPRGPGRHRDVVAELLLVRQPGLVPPVPQDDDPRVDLAGGVELGFPAALLPAGQLGPGGGGDLQPPVPPLQHLEHLLLQLQLLSLAAPAALVGGPPPAPRAKHPATAPPRR